MKTIESPLIAFDSMKSDVIENCLNNIGFYIIQKIREEDFRKDEYLLEEEEKAGGNQNLMDEEIKTKIGITEQILNNRDILVNLEDFYEEECQLSLLTWAFDIHRRYKQYRSSTLDYNENINKDFFNKNNSLNNNVEILLFNILNIFEKFPIKPDDLKSLNFIEKLKVIKKDMKNQNIIIYKKIKNLIKFWKSMIKLFEKQSSKLVPKQNNLIFNKKRQREESEIEEKVWEKTKKYDGIKEENDNNSSHYTIYETDLSEHTETKKKSVSWKNDDILISKIEYDPNDAPSILLK